MVNRRGFLSAGFGLSVVVLGKGTDRTETFDVRKFGAEGNGVTNDREAIQRAIDACAKAGGGQVLLPAGGTYLSGNLQLRSHVRFSLEGGATLKASGNRQDFAEFGALLFAKDTTNVEITGTGTIDGHFAAYLTEVQEGGFKVTFPFLGPYDPLYTTAEQDTAHGRPRMVLLVGCENARLNSFTIRDAPTWTMHLIGCRSLLIDGINILNDLRVPNCDAIDIDHCQDVRVVNSNLQAGDDCIVLKTSRNFTQYGPCENINVTGCSMISSSAAIKIEPEGPAAIRDVTITGCTIRRSNRGICILNRDGSLIENIICSNLVIGTELRAAMWWGAGEPVHVSNLPRNPQTKVGPVRRLRFLNLICHGESGLYLCGGTDSPLEDVVFDDVEVLIERTSTLTGGYYDLRPGIGLKGLYHHSIAGIYCEHAKDLAFRQTSVKWSGDLPDYYGTGLEANEILGLELESCHFVGAHSGRDPNQVIDGKANGVAG